MRVLKRIHLIVGVGAVVAALVVSVVGVDRFTVDSWSRRTSFVNTALAGVELAHSSIVLIIPSSSSSTPAIVCKHYAYPGEARLVCAGTENLVTITLSRTGRSVVQRVGFRANGFEQFPTRTLRLGETWRGGGFRCTSRPKGLTCANPSGHGFWLGRQRGFRLF
jgi:Family of unknown function (DUF6636)